MAVSVATGAMGSLIAKLTALTLSDRRLGSSDEEEEHVREEMVLLKDELSSVSATLEKLAHRGEEEGYMNMWTREVREMSYDMEDFIDQNMFTVAGLHDHVYSNPAGFLRKTAGLIRKPWSRNRIAHQMRQFKARLVEATEQRDRFRPRSESLDLHLDQALAIDPRLPALSATELVGMDVPRDMLIKLLTDEHQQLRVVSVMGMGGLGKTTLACEVYRNIKDRFHCGAFLHASQKPDIKKILRDILRQVGLAEEYANEEDWDELPLVHTVREYLCDKRYFIIIDDVWSTLAWRAIRCALPENNLGSRILITTRIISVAKSCCCHSEDHVFQMKPLIESEARKLFFTRIFGSEYDCPPHLKGVSNSIMEVCGGLPLALVSLADLLVTKSYTIEFWERVLHDIHFSLGKDCIFDNMRKILCLSYVELPLYLRTCLLYLTMFPKDYEINKDWLIRRWMAEGFITSKRGHNPEKVGERYFNELIDRSMIQPVEIEYDGQANSCQVHGMIFDFIASKSIEENFTTLYAGHVKNGLRRTSKVRRLSLDSRDQGNAMVTSMIDTSQVRTLTIFGSVNQMPPLSDFPSLRVLDLETGRELDGPCLENIGRLFHLKYLRLQTTSVVKLPAQIGELQNLETLDLTKTPINKLPRNIVRLKQLKHLLVNNVELPDDIGNLQALCELSCVKVDHSSEHSLHELGRLTKLRILGLNWCNSKANPYMVDSLVSSLNKISRLNLESLSIQSGDACSLDFLLDSWCPPHCLLEFRMIANFYFPRVPDWMASLSNLTFLDINIDPVQEQVFQILGALPALLALLLTSRSAASEQRLLIGNDGFYFLKRFDFTCWSTGIMLMFEPGAMPRLIKLMLLFSAHQQSVYGQFDSGIEHLSSLKNLHVQINCRRSKAREVEAAEIAMRNAANLLPNHPTIKLQRLDEQHMVKD